MHFPNRESDELRVDTPAVKLPVSNDTTALQVLSASFFAGAVEENCLICHGHALNIVRTRFSTQWGPAELLLFQVDEHDPHQISIVERNATAPSHSYTLYTSLIAQR